LPLSEALRAILSQYGYQYDCVEGADFRFHARTSQGDWRTQVQLHESQGVARIFVYLDQEYPPPRLEFVRELIEQVNAVIVFGHFTFLNGSVAFHYGYDASERSDTRAGLERALKVAALPISLWTRAIIFCERPNISASTALDVALAAEEAKEAEGLAEESLRELLEVLDGDASKVTHTASPAHATLKLLS
jgi:hypothetical protein